MIPLTDAELADRCEALSNPARVRILRLLLREELYVGNIQQQTGYTQTMTSRHLAFLERHQLVHSRKQAHHKYYRIREDKRTWLEKIL